MAKIPDCGSVEICSTQLSLTTMSLSFNGRTVASKPTDLGSNPSGLANNWVCKLSGRAPVF